jgi:integrase/recombinase XerD
MTIRYTSFLAHRFTDFVAFRRSLGFGYGSQASILHQFDAVVQVVMTEPGPVTRAVVDAWLRSMSELRPTTRRVRLGTVRQFLIYLRRFEPETYVPERSLLPVGASPRRPHIYTQEEMQALLREAQRFPARYRSRRWLLYHTLIGFLYVTGLRVSEALALTLADLDLAKGLVHVRKTKFHKSRFVPLMPSSCTAVQRYLMQRAERGHATTADAPVFVGAKGGRLPYSTARNGFRQIVEMAGLRVAPGEIGLRIHDLRHTAAVRRLYLWYRQDRDVQALLPVLVTYLGHSAVHCTEVYLTATTELLAEASARFQEHYPLGSERRGESRS